MRASFWPSSTDRMPARTISAMYAPSFRLSARSTAVIVGTRVLVDSLQSDVPPNGM